MSDNQTLLLKDITCTPWNKGRLVGAKPPLRAKHVWSIRTRLIIERRIRDLAMFNLAIDSKLRGCDVVAVRVEDVAPNGYSGTRDRPAEEDGKAGQVRTNRTNPAGDRGLPASVGQEVGRISVHESSAARPLHDNAPVRAPGVRMDW
jgi:hypothetical protein